VFTVVNALGVIVDRQGQVVRGGLDQRTGERTTPIQDAEDILSGASVRLQPGETLPGGLTRYTTLTVLVTNVAFPRELLRQLGRQVHSSMARAIQPFHTPDDGDILFTVSTGEVAAEEIDRSGSRRLRAGLGCSAGLSCPEHLGQHGTQSVLSGADSRSFRFRPTLLAWAFAARGVTDPKPTLWSNPNEGLRRAGSSGELDHRTTGASAERSKTVPGHGMLVATNRG
jgi:hypothetical protein